ncbi:MAG: DedA family protein [Mycoplasmataceae bacterium]|jgi:membrane-associated protein|nr:DedA family protein [Mycoplasmataceae bacterium]
MGTIIDFIIHIDKHLIEIINNYGSITYLILFLIIFCETGLVIMPILPGDSLLFVCGALAALKALNILVIFFVLFLAAILGDACNYAIGKYLGHRLLSNDKSRFIKKEHILKTKTFFEKHGPKTIVLARFVPIVRTFAPFLAGSGDMKYVKFFSYNVIGAFFWVSIFVFGGYFFGNIPIIKNNLTFLGLGIVIISLLPIIIIQIKNKLNKTENS